MPLHLRANGNNHRVVIRTPLVNKHSRPSSIGPYVFFVSLLLLLSTFFRTIVQIPPVSRPLQTRLIARQKAHPTYMVIPAYGGVGNQIYFLLEALFLARHANLSLVIPSVPMRKAPNSSGGFVEEPGYRYWDISALKRAVAPRGDVVTRFPEECNSSIHRLYTVARRQPQDSLPGRVTSRVRQVMWFQLEDADWGDEVPPRNEWECEKHVFAETKMQHWTLPLQFPANRSLINELARLKKIEKTRPSCIVVDGHAFNVGGKKGHEYLHSFMHYIRATSTIVGAANRMDAGSMAVVHIRHDENLCVNEEKNKNRVCIRTQLTIKEGSGIDWIPVGEFVNVVLRVMHRHDVERVYLSTAPYVRENVVKTIREGLGKKVTVVEQVEDSPDTREFKNFVERELGIGAKVFIGDLGSTWSGTVHYKRRTLGKRTVWSCEMVGQCKGIGYYEDMSGIPRPEEYEMKWEFWK